MSVLQGSVRDQAGNVSPGTTVSIYVHGTVSLATLYSNDGLTTPLANPVPADSTGDWLAYLDDGLFDVVLARAGYPTKTAVGVPAINPANYARLAGAAGGQTLVGDPAAGGFLFLRGSSNATPGTVRVDDSSFVFNEAGADRDARFEGDTEPFLFFTDASTDRVAIGGSGSPTHRLDVRVSQTGSTVMRLQNTHASGFGGVSMYDEAGAETFIIAVDNASNVSRINSVNSHPIGFFTGSVERLAIGAAGVVIFNDPGNDCDVRMEGVADQFLFFLDASAGYVGIGTGAPGAKLQVKSSGAIAIFEGTGTETQIQFPSNTSGVPYTWLIRLSGTSPSFSIRDNNAGTEPFAVQAGAATNTLFVGVNRNIVLAAGSVTSGVGVIGMGSGTAPTTSPADVCQLWVADSAAGDAQFFTRNEAGKIERLTGLVARNSAQFDMTSNTTLTNVTGLTHNVEAGKIYRFTARLPTTSNLAGGVKAAIAGTCTATAITYEGLTIAAGATTQGRGAALGTAVGAVTAVTAAWIELSGTIVVNAAGTLTVQFAQNVSSGSASSVLANGSFEIQQIG